MQPIFGIVGATATGKTNLSLLLASKFGFEILSADSRQIYKEMKIATSPPTSEELQAAKHYFIHSESIHYPINAGKYGEKFDLLMKELNKKNIPPLIVGGTGLYIQSALRGFHQLPTADAILRKELEKKTVLELKQILTKKDAEVLKKIDLQNKQRLIRAVEICTLSGKKYSELIKAQNTKKYASVLIGLEMEKEVLKKKVEKRVWSFFEKGLEKEAEKLYKWKDYSVLQTVGYSELFKMLEKNISIDETMEKIITNTMKYAKRQKTWFRNKENVTWFQYDDIDSVISFVEKKLLEVL